MIHDLFEDGVRDVRLAPGATLLCEFARRFEAPCVTAPRRVVEIAPFRHMVTPGGHRMSVAMTNCGAVGWVTDRTATATTAMIRIPGVVGRPCPTCSRISLPRRRRARASAASRPTRVSSTGTSPGASLSLHQDKNERDFSAPIVSVSLGLPAVFLLGDCVEPTGRAACRWLMVTWSSGVVPPAFATTASRRSRRDITS